MDLLLFIIFIFLSSSFILFLNYYRKLFDTSKDNFARKDLIDFKNIFLNELNHILGENKKKSYLEIGVGVMIGLIFTHMGGLYGAYYESYFFNSFILPFLLYLGLPYLKDNFEETINRIPLLNRIISNNIPFTFGTSTCIMAQLLVVYGLYHSINFLWVMINYILILFMFMYKIYSTEKNMASFVKIKGNYKNE